MGKGKLVDNKGWFSFILEKEEKEILKEYAKKLGMSLSAYIRFILREKIKEIKKQNQKEA